jgi:hypothetical protein
LTAGWVSVVRPKRRGRSLLRPSEKADLYQQDYFLIKHDNLKVYGEVEIYLISFLT